jgi:hypothetical protein
MSSEYRIFDGEGEIPRQKPVRGWRKLFTRIIDEPPVTDGGADGPTLNTEESMPLYAKLFPGQRKALVRIEDQIDARFSALGRGKPKSKSKTVNYKYLGDKPVMHEMGFILKDHRYDSATVRTESDRYRGVHVSTHDPQMEAALIELYLAKEYHVLATQITLNDSRSVMSRRYADHDSGLFWDLDICKDKLPEPRPNPFCDVVTQSFGK